MFVGSDLKLLSASHLPGLQYYNRHVPNFESSKLNENSTHPALNCRYETEQTFNR